MQSLIWHRSRKFPHIIYNSEQTQQTSCKKRYEENRNDAIYKEQQLSIYNATIKNIEDEFEFTTEQVEQVTSQR